MDTTKRILRSTHIVSGTYVLLQRIWRQLSGPQPSVHKNLYVQHIQYIVSSTCKSAARVLPAVATSYLQELLQYPGLLAADSDVRAG